MSVSTESNDPASISSRAFDVPHERRGRECTVELPSATRRWIAQLWRLVQACAVAAAMVHPIATLFSRQSWLADLICHFQEPAVGATVFAALLTLRGHRRVSIGLLGLALFQLAPILRFNGMNPVPPDPKSTNRLRLLMVNVLFENEDYEAVARLIREEKPDVIGLVEFTAAWGEGLRSIRDEYPYGTEYSNGRPSGVALWFREKPLSIDPPTWPVPRRNPMLHATFKFAGKARHLWLVHPTSPLLRRVWQAGNPEIDAIALRVAEVAGSRIVMGDMNSTDGSAHFRDFLRTTGLRDSRTGFGRQGSWPNDQPYRIAIDHLFVSEDLAVVSRKLGPEVGSDHFPLIVELAPAARKASTQPAQVSTTP